MRSASIYYDKAFAGTLTETDEGLFTFAYDSAYIQQFPGQYLTFSMPVSDKVYTEKRLFPFFEGPDDAEELALTLEGKKRKLEKAHLVGFAEDMGLNVKQITGVFRRFLKNRPVAIKWIENSFLSDRLKTAYETLLNDRYRRLE